MDAEERYYDDEIDLREIVLTLFKGWKTILLMTILVGAAAFGYSKLQAPVYEAVTAVYIDQETLGLSINPANILLSDAVRLNVAERLAIPVNNLPGLSNANENELPSVLISQIEKGTATWMITVQSEGAQSAFEIANSWAEAGVAVIMDSIATSFREEEASQLALSQAELALIDYLDTNKLSAWSWTDLTVLTGIGQQATLLLSDNTEITPSVINLTDTVNGLPAISLQQRFEIAQLMRTQLDATSAFYLAHNEAVQLRHIIATTPPVVLSHATLPEKPVSPKIVVNTALGLVLGGMLGVFWVFVAGWWRNSATEEDVVDSGR